MRKTSKYFKGMTTSSALPINLLVILNSENKQCVNTS